MSASVPKSIARQAITKGVQSLPAQILDHAPAIFDAIGAAFRGLGYELDLGPMTPDARKHFGEVDDRIAAKLDELERPARDPDKAPPPRSSER